MKTRLILGLYFGCVAACAARQPAAQYDWKKLSAAGQVPWGVVAEVDGRSVLKVANTNDTALQAQLLKIPEPPVTNLLYAVTGEIRYEGVRGDGYLELWSCFPPLKPGMMEGRYFSRTLGESGPMGKITGTSGWRTFTLPFDRHGAEKPPSRLEINLFLPAQGTVYIGPIKLVEYAGGLSDLGKPGAAAWWSDRQAGLMGGIGGAGIGCLAGLLAWMASRGRARSFVIGALEALIGLGIALAVGGVAALAAKQPYAVWFPLGLGAVLLLSIIPFRLRQIQKLYEDLELRRMASMDIVKG